MLKKKTVEYVENNNRCNLTVTYGIDYAFAKIHNQSPYFSITADLVEHTPYGRHESSGCLHDEIESNCPELSHLIKWHLCATDGPMHYVANAVYWAEMVMGISKWPNDSRTDPLEAFKSTVVFGSVDGDDIGNLFAPIDAHSEDVGLVQNNGQEARLILYKRVDSWCKARHDALMLAFRKDMDGLLE